MTGTPISHERVRELHLQGLGYREIMERLGASRSCIVKHLFKIRGRRWNKKKVVEAEEITCAPTPAMPKIHCDFLTEGIE